MAVSASCDRHGMPVGNSAAVDILMARHPATQTPLVGWVTDANPDPKLSAKIPYWRETNSDSPKLLTVRVPAPRHWQLPPNPAHSELWNAQARYAPVQTKFRVTRVACWADISDFVEVFGSEAQPKWHQCFDKDASNPFAVKHYPPKPLSQSKEPPDWAGYMNARVEGQTIAYVPQAGQLSNPQHTHDELVGVLGYKSKIAMYYHTDNQCKSCDPPRHLRGRRTG